MLKTLIKAGANVNHQSKDGSTALIFAATNSRYDLVKILLKKGADAKLKNHSGYIALNYARSWQICKEIQKHMQA